MTWTFSRLHHLPLGYSLSNFLGLSNFSRWLNNNTRHSCFFYLSSLSWRNSYSPYHSEYVCSVPSFNGVGYVMFVCHWAFWSLISWEWNNSCDVKITSGVHMLVVKYFERLIFDSREWIHQPLTFNNEWQQKVNLCLFVLVLGKFTLKT